MVVSKEGRKNSERKKKAFGESFVLLEKNG
jgi:hypothetical protein